MLGLREGHKLLDIGCGSLRGGRFFIPYLNPGNYFGVEPNTWLVYEGMENELGPSIQAIKEPKFHDTSDFEFGWFREKFDFVIAQSIFSHTPPKLLTKCLRNLRAVTHADTIFAFTYFPGDNSYSQSSEWIADGKVVSYNRYSFPGYVNKEGWFMRELKLKHPSGQIWCVAVTDVAIIELINRRLKRWSGQIYQ